MNNLRILPLPNHNSTKPYYYRITPDKNVLRKNKVRMLLNFGTIENLTYKHHNYKYHSNAKCIIEETYKLLKKK